jgi:hypothetical protein
LSHFTESRRKTSKVVTLLPKPAVYREPPLMLTQDIRHREFYLEDPPIFLL